jgi:hypothetical protein
MRRRPADRGRRFAAIGIVGRQRMCRRLVYSGLPEGMLAVLIVPHHRRG